MADFGTVLKSDNSTLTLFSAGVSALNGNFKTLTAGNIVDVSTALALYGPSSNSTILNGGQSAFLLFGRGTTSYLNNITLSPSFSDFTLTLPGVYSVQLNCSVLPSLDSGAITTLQLNSNGATIATNFYTSNGNNGDGLPSLQVEFSLNQFVIVQNNAPVVLQCIALLNTGSKTSTFFNNSISVVKVQSM
jgi:hypothetical protein